MTSRWKRFERQVADPDALHFLDGMAGLKEPVAKRIAASFGNRHLIPRSVGATQPRNLSAGGARQFLDLLECEQRFQLQVISLRELMRLNDAVRDDRRRW